MKKRILTVIIFVSIYWSFLYDFSFHDSNVLRRLAKNKRCLSTKTLVRSTDRSVFLKEFLDKQRKKYNFTLLRASFLGIIVPTKSSRESELQRIFSLFNALVEKLGYRAFCTAFWSFRDDFFLCSLEFHKRLETILKGYSVFSTISYFCFCIIPTPNVQT